MEPPFSTEELKPKVSKRLSELLVLDCVESKALNDNQKNILVNCYVKLVPFPTKFEQLQTDLDKVFPTILSSREAKAIQAETKNKALIAEAKAKAIQAETKNKALIAKAEAEAKQHKATFSGFHFKRQDSVIFILKFSTYDELQKQLFPQSSLSCFNLRNSKPPNVIYQVDATNIWNVFSLFPEDCLLIASKKPSHTVSQSSQSQNQSQNQSPSSRNYIREFEKDGINNKCTIGALNHVPPGVYENSVKNFYTNLHESNFDSTLLTTDDSKFFINHLFFPDFRKDSEKNKTQSSTISTTIKSVPHETLCNRLVSDALEAHFQGLCYLFLNQINGISADLEKNDYKKYLVPQFGKSKYATGYLRQSKLRTDIYVHVKQYPFLLIENKSNTINAQELQEEWLNLFNSAKVLLLSRLYEQSVDPKKRSSQTSTNIQPFIYVGLWQLDYTTLKPILTLEIKKVSLLNIDNNQLEPVARDNFPVCSYRHVCTFNSSESSDLAQHFRQIERFILQDPLYQYLQDIQSPLYTLGIRKYEPHPLVIILAANRDSKNIEGKNPRPAEKPKSHLPTFFQLDLTGVKSTNLPKLFSKAQPCVRLSKNQSNQPPHSQSIQNFDQKDSYYYYVRPGYFLIANYKFLHIQTKASSKSNILKSNNNSSIDTILNLNLSKQIPAFPLFYDSSFPNYKLLGIPKQKNNKKIPILLSKFFGDQITGNPQIQRDKSKKLFLEQTEEVKKQLIIQLAFQLYHLHKNEIFHNDIHPNNIIVVKVDNPAATTSNTTTTPTANNEEFPKCNSNVAMLLIDWNFITLKNQDKIMIPSPYYGAYQFFSNNFNPSKGNDCYSAALTLLFFMMKDLAIFHRNKNQEHETYKTQENFTKKHSQKLNDFFYKFTTKNVSSTTQIAPFIGSCNLTDFNSYQKFFEEIFALQPDLEIPEENP